MNTRTLTHQDTFVADTDELFQLLHTPSAIRHWWNADRAIVIPQTGGMWVAAWGESEDSPDYITAAVIAEFTPHKRLVLQDYQYYSAVEDPLPFDANITTTFEVQDSEKGSSLQVIQDGFPSDSNADEFFQACKQGWIDTFDGIRSYLSKM
jgi:uncharacterized protein YndB with AHSA1/START domain